MLKLRKFLAGTIAAAMVFAVSGCDPSKLSLYINAKKGDTYKYHTVVKSKTEMDAMGQKVNGVQDITTDYLVKVEDIDSEGTMSVNYKFDAIKVDMESNGSKQSYDSKKPDKNNPLSTLYDNMVGAEYSTQMTKHGQVKEVKGLDKFYDSILAGIPSKGNEDEAKLKEQISSMLKQNFGNDAIKSALEQTTNIFPKGDVKVGDSWEQNYTLNMMFKLDIKIKFTLDKVEKDIAYLAVQAEFASDKTKPVSVMGVEMKPDMKGTMSGTMKVNKNNGFLSEGSIKQELSGKFLFGAGDSKETEIPMKINTDLEYSTVKQ